MHGLVADDKAIGPRRIDAYEEGVSCDVDAVEGELGVESFGADELNVCAKRRLIPLTSGATASGTS
jgi:hypothetical protein